jgi:hypothetical protein
MFEGYKFQGKGTYSYPDGRRLEGNWQDNYLEGIGTEYLPAGNPQEKYVGSFAKTGRNGKGILYYRNGNRFEGTWKEGRTDGMRLNLDRMDQYGRANMRRVVAIYRERLLEKVKSLYQQTTSV